MDNQLQSGANAKTNHIHRRTSRQNLSGNRSTSPQTQNSKPELTYLDLFSTSQTKRDNHRPVDRPPDRRIFDACVNNAPYFGYQIDGKKWGIVQGCCNDWNCPRCGQQRAREEYGRIVVGSREIAKFYPLYLFTITCRGKELNYEQAEAGFLEWTNRLLTRLRTATKRVGGAWFYASVTERQDRLHPHSHFITTYCPLDTIDIPKGRQKYFFTEAKSYPAKHNTLQSETLERACVECGLGRQYDLSRIESVEGASRYAAKYLFKAAIFETRWPKGWRRVRYSQNWPKLPEVKSDALLLLRNEDWEHLARLALIVQTKDDGAHAVALSKLRHADVIIN